MERIQMIFFLWHRPVSLSSLSSTPLPLLRIYFDILVKIFRFAQLKIYIPECCNGRGCHKLKKFIYLSNRKRKKSFSFLLLRLCALVVLLLLSSFFFLIHWYVIHPLSFFQIVWCDVMWWLRKTTPYDMNNCVNREMKRRKKNDAVHKRRLSRKYDVCAHRWT